MTLADINSWIRWALTKSSKTLLSSQASVKSSGQGGSSDTSHIVLSYADKFVEGVLQWLVRWNRHLVWRDANVQVSEGLLLSSTITFPTLVRCSFSNIEYNYKVYHCSNGNILELSCCQKHCLLWLSSIHTCTQ